MGRLIDLATTALTWLRSYRGSVIILSMLCLLLGVWVVPFQVTGQSKATVDAIAWGWLPLQVAYALVAIATVYCTYVRIVRDVRRARRGPYAKAEPSQHATPIPAGDLEHLAGVLKANGYEVQADEGRIVAVKNRWSTLGGSVFHLSILFFALAVLLQHFTAQTAQVRVTEGQSFSQAAQGSEPWAARAVAGLTLKRIEPTYFRDVLLFTRLDSTLTNASGAQLESSLSQPLWLDLFTHMSVQDYGLAPSFKVTDAKGKVLDDVTVALALNPPGARDSVSLPISGVNLSVVAYPDYGVVGGKDVSLTYNLRNPRLRVSATEKVGKVTSRGLIGVGEKMKVGDRTVELTGIARHGTFSLFRTYATIPIALASLLMLAGLVIRLFVPRHDVAVWQCDDGLYADAWLDAYGREAGMNRAAALLAEGATS